LAQEGNSIDQGDWILHPDLVLGLKLKRENDEWLAMNEGYVPIVRLGRDEDGSPNLMEIRASHLKDFLAATNEVLCVSTYRSRMNIDSDRSAVDWSASEQEEELGHHNKWRGSITELTEDGHPFGSSMAVFHVGRPTFDLDEEVPEIRIDDEFKTSKFTKTFDQGEKPTSTRVRGDDIASSIYFFTDAAGNRENAETLDQKGRWLPFAPFAFKAVVVFALLITNHYSLTTVFPVKPLAPLQIAHTFGSIGDIRQKKFACSLVPT